MQSFHMLARAHSATGGTRGTLLRSMRALQLGRTCAWRLGISRLRGPGRQPACDGIWSRHLSAGQPRHARADSGWLEPILGPESPAKPALEAFRTACNNFLQATGSPVRIQPGELPVVSAVTKSDHVPTQTVKSPVAKEDIDAYVDCLLLHPDSIVNSRLVPDAMEKHVYIAVVHIVLQMFQLAVGIADGRAVFGEMLRKRQSRDDQPLLLTKSTLEIVDRFATFIDVADEGIVITESVNRALYQNIARFALQMIVDAASSLRISIFGMTFIVRAETAHLEKHMHRVTLDVSTLEAACEHLVQQFLADEDVNIGMMPDAQEEKLYRTVLKLVANVFSAAVDASELDADSE